MRTQLKQLLQTALEQLIQRGDISTYPTSLQIDQTRDPQHGDFASNVAMLLSKPSKLNPRALAEKIIELLPVNDLLDRVEIAGPGFINFFVKPSAYYPVLTRALSEKDIYGHSDIGQGKRIHIEYVSANPTGPLHVGHGRGAAYGASLSNVLEAAGYTVHREYYVNDAGRQMRGLALSVWVRYLQLFGEEITLPEKAYQGDYIVDIAKALKAEHTDNFLISAAKINEGLPKEDENPDAYLDAIVSKMQTLLGEQNFNCVFAAGLNIILSDIREDLAEFGVTYQHWFHESELVKSGMIEHGIEKLKAAGYMYESQGALWFQATKFGDEEDRVVIRANGLPTYFASDIAYHLHKYEQGFSIIIDVFGADHHGYMPRVKAFLQALDKNPDQFEVLLVQFAILYRGKVKVPMSTRSGQFVTLREVREEIGNDATRYFYIMRKPEQHLDFDLELAKAQSTENPVYYIQYAHARICSVFTQLNAKQLSYSSALTEEQFQLLEQSHEKQLLRSLEKYPPLIEYAATQREPHTIAHYLLELAQQFHTYYNASQFIVEDDALRQARLSLVSAVRIVLKNGLTLIGVSAPEIM